MFLRDFWYAAAWDHEIKQAPLARIIRGEPIVFYRQTNSALSAFEDCGAWARQSIKGRAVLVRSRRWL